MITMDSFYSAVSLKLAFALWKAYLSFDAQSELWDVQTTTLNIASGPSYVELKRNRKGPQKERQFVFELLVN